MEDIIAINHRLLMLETAVQQMANEKEIMKGRINYLSETVDVLMRNVNDLEQKVSSKVDIGDVPATNEQICKHEWTNIRIPGDDGIYVACPKCQSVDVEETRRLSRELRAQKEEEQNG
ncbi:hypothetical protein FOC89_22980 [Bacillus thuringiensis]|uniref:Uncharacterized protein n=1 Tax=Bacillus thuringiensis TaxID=1428 RepID=A0A0B5NYY3_BACTU|nr:hypothetical protein [Bacillus thuringiensis]AJG78662.1 hypothetical protein BF38_3062 [Bacillus thuringiensis]MCU5427568.1 hypothetical protein [Bacillus cereus]OTX45155.1 hypothetical protein BK723_31090 [Bacillus thuringiensis serovar pondicheriensis]QKH26689.1 hypothetical protein FOC89_22980 [Bacillus thuringiensis]